MLGKTLPNSRDKGKLILSLPVLLIIFTTSNPLKYFPCCLVTFYQETILVMNHFSFNLLSQLNDPWVQQKPGALTCTQFLEIFAI